MIWFAEFCSNKWFYFFIFFGFSMYLRNPSSWSELLLLLLRVFQLGHEGSQLSSLRLEQTIELTVYRKGMLQEKHKQLYSIAVFFLFIFGSWKYKTTWIIYMGLCKPIYLINIFGYNSVTQCCEESKFHSLILNFYQIKKARNSLRSAYFLLQSR